MPRPRSNRSAAGKSPGNEKVKRGLISVINCQRSNKKITVDRANPDLTHCYSCSKKLVDGPALARTL